MSSNPVFLSQLLAILAKDLRTEWRTREIFSSMFVFTVLVLVGAEERTIILSTHDLKRGLRLCDDIVIQHQGKIVYRGLASDVDEISLEQLYFDYVK